MSELYPLLFTPVLKDYIWGGRALETRFGRKLPPGVVAESWEIAAHKDGESIIDKKIKKILRKTLLKGKDRLNEQELDSLEEAKNQIKKMMNLI